MPTSPDRKPPSLPRRRTALLALFVAAAASAAACSPPNRSISVQTAHTGTLTVRTEAPMATRHLRVRVSAERAPSEPISMHLEGKLTSHWRPDDPTEQRKPLIRGRFDGFSSDWGALAGFGILDDMSSASMWGSRDDDCKLQQACEWLVPLDIEVQPKNTTGAIDVQWQVSVRASVSLPGDEDLPGLAVQITEE